MEGLPVLRYFTHFPIRFVRDIGFVKIAVVLIAVAGVLSFAGGAAVQLPDQPIVFDDSSGINATAVEYHIHEEINERRAERGLSQLEFDAQLQQIARGHSKDMANRSYFSHEDPAGDNFADRYTEAGYDCRVATSGNSYATGAENIAYTWYDRRVEMQGEKRYYSNSSDVAKGVVNWWMNSTNHRKNILKPYWKSEGVGIKITDSEKVYATQNFC
ncbi:CAP domain-containing protein [Haloarcula sp. H-GB5]